MAEADNTPDVDLNSVPGITNETCLGYRLGRKLGAGGFAFVREAYSRSGERVAIKFIKMDTKDRVLAKVGNSIVAVDPESKKPLDTIPSRLKRTLKEITTELMALQMTKSKNVVKLHKYKLNHPYKMSDGTEWNSIAMVLENCEHGELFDLVYHGEALDEKVCRTFFRQIVNGLEALHDKNISHRDIKPQNILMTRNFECKLADLGSGQRIKESRLMKTNRVGTRGFQAPELLCQKNYSKKCDTFSLGVTLFVLMSKTMPCREEANVNDPLYVYMAAKKYDDYWGKFARGGINFSDDLKELLQGMLAYQPVERMNINDTVKDEKVLKGIKTSKWYNDEIYDQAELCNVLRDRFALARSTRNRVRNPDTEIHSQSFRSGKPTVLPPLPPRREFWAIPLEKEASITDTAGNVVRLHPDHVIQTIMNKFEVLDKRCTCVYKTEEAELELKATGEGDVPIQVNVNAYERDDEYYMDIVPIANWHHPDCLKLKKDLDEFLQITQTGK